MNCQEVVMELKAVIERELRPISGFLGVLVAIVGCVLSTFAFSCGIVLVESGQTVASVDPGLLTAVGVVGWFVFGMMFAGLKVVHPNEARILTLFGKYHGTIKTAGFFFVNPFCYSFGPNRGTTKTVHRQKAIQVGETADEVQVHRRSLSLKIQTLDNGLQKVNDVLGNPVIIGAVVIWRVEKPTQAVFSVENHVEYLGIQTDSTIRNTARLFPYDVFDEDEADDGIHEKTMRGSSLEIAETMKAELQKRVDEAGLVIEEVRITHLAYAEEIAAAMLQRQQAVAIIAARKKIVEGAVGMVKDAVDRLSENHIVVLDDERKAAMVSNLLVVLVGNHDAQPIVNTGSIY
jgi:regulator of protease activity HflC (stomatin/prohibitin superfamily)